MANILGCSFKQYYVKHIEELLPQLNQVKLNGIIVINMVDTIGASTDYLQ